MCYYDTLSHTNLLSNTDEKCQSQKAGENVLKLLLEQDFLINDLQGVNILNVLKAF